jgi:hypothetical protein
MGRAAVFRRTQVPQRIYLAQARTSIMGTFFPSLLLLTNYFDVQRMKQRRRLDDVRRAQRGVQGL